MLIANVLSAETPERFGLERTLWHGTDGWSIAFSPQGDLLAACDDRTIKVWDTSTWTAIRTIENDDLFETVLAWSPDGSKLASISSNHMIRIWDTVSWSNVKILTENQTVLVRGISWSPDGKLLAAGLSDTTIKIWNTQTWSIEKQLLGHTDVVESVAWSPDGALIASGSRNEMIIWASSAGAKIYTLTSAGTTYISWSPEGSRLASWSHGHQYLRIWDTLTWLNTHNLTISSGFGYLFSIAWSSDGAKLAFGSLANYDRCEIEIWDAVHWVKTQRLIGHSSNIWSIAWSPDGSVLISASENGEINIWSQDTDGDGVADITDAKPTDPQIWEESKTDLGGSEDYSVIIVEVIVIIILLIIIVLLKKR